MTKATVERENSVFNYDDFLQAFKKKREAVDNLEKEKGNLNVNGKKLEDVIKEKLKAAKDASKDVSIVNNEPDEQHSS